MGKPRMILVIRHAQSEGNKDRSIHQTTPDHRVPLTAEGWEQAEEAGWKLRGMLNADDTIQFYVSPYQRTRETAEGILKSLTSDEGGPSSFPRDKIQVWEEPRLREQDFGNYQPDSEAMERMWHQRSSYGHFFFRIPNGESAADAYDRVSGFNETLWRSFSDDDCPSVCILVTHGLMTRIFLMRWFHWSVEYFEDLRNVNHCEIVTMRKDQESGKYRLETELRTWTERKRLAAQAERERRGSDAKDDLDARFPPVPTKYWSTTSHHYKEPSPRGEASAVRGGKAPADLPRSTDEKVISAPQGHNEHRGRGDISAAQVSSLLGTAAMEEDDEAFPHIVNHPEPDVSVNETAASSCSPSGEGGVRKKAGKGMHLDFSSQMYEAASAVPTPHESPHLNRDYGFTQAYESSSRRSEPENAVEEAISIGESGVGGRKQRDVLDDNEHASNLQEVEEAEAEDRSVRGSVY